MSNQHHPGIDAAIQAVNEAPAALKFGPAAAVNALSLGGIPLDQWVYAVTLVWLLLQIGGWIYDRIKRSRDKEQP